MIIKLNGIEIFTLKLGNTTISRAFSERMIAEVGRPAIYKELNREFDFLTAKYYREKKT